MPTYQIEIREFLARILEIEANDAEEAYQIVKAKYQNQEIVLDSEDYVTTEIDEYKDE